MIKRKFDQLVRDTEIVQNKELAHDKAEVVASELDRLIMRIRDLETRAIAAEYMMRDLRYRLDQTEQRDSTCTTCGYISNYNGETHMHYVLDNNNFPLNLVYTNSYQPINYTTETVVWRYGAYQKL